MTCSWAGTARIHRIELPFAVRVSLLQIVLVSSCSTAALAQPAVTTKPRPQPTRVVRQATGVKPQVYRLPRELTGREGRPFATEFYGVSPRPKKPVPPAAKKAERTAQR